ncbi:MAG: hypothetical protein QE269_07320 [Fimbriimonas sp.]|nr:hypothetical protein [Fimbriimonas sp.]
METGSDEEVKPTNPVWEFVKGGVKGFVIAFVVVFPFSCAYGFWQASGRHKYINQTAAHAKLLAQSWLLYAADSDQRTCLSENWNAALAGYYKDARVLEDANIETGERRGIGLNPGFAGKSMSTLPEMRRSLVFALTTNLGKDALVSKSTLRSYSDAIDVIVVATGDGKSYKTRFSKLQSLFWEVPASSSGR